jgi:aryl-phospho-beta-D-glucosidase BglC (GH1 family)
MAPGRAIAGERPTAREAAGAMGKGFNLGQMFDNTQHPPTLADARPKIDAYYARGFRLVRIPVTWTEPVDGGVLADPETGRLDRDSPRLAELEAVIDYALAQPGMYVVVNAHHETRLKESGRAEVLAQLWSDIAETFKDRDGRLVFEILNEPHLSNHDPMPPETLRAMTGEAYRRIRQIDPGRIVVIGGNQWFGAQEMAAAWPNIDAVGGGRDPYVMATFHHYNPWTFNGDNQGDYADPWTDEDVSGPMRTMAQWAATTGKGMPVFIGEWGVGWQSRFPTMNCNNIRLWYARFDAVHARAFGMPTAVWDDGGWFQLFDHAQKAFSSNLIDCIDGSCRWDGSDRFNADCL